MSLHVNDLAWRIHEALTATAGPGGQLVSVEEPELVKRDEAQSYPERDGIVRLIAHGDLRDIEIVLVSRDSRAWLREHTEQEHPQ